MDDKNVEWEKHREAKRIVGDAIGAGSGSPLLFGHLLTPEQLERLSVGMGGVESREDYRAALTALSSRTGVDLDPGADDANHLLAVAVVRGDLLSHHWR